MASQHIPFQLIIVFILGCIHMILALPPNNPNQIPFTCIQQSTTCKSILYQHNQLTKNNISSLYSVNTSQIHTITHGDKQDYLVTVPCYCQNVNNTVAYFYNTIYSVTPGDTFSNVSDQFYSGQAWDEGTSFKANTNATMHLLCGCTKSDSQVMVTYTVQEMDTLPDIARLLSAEVSEIEDVNKGFLQKPGFIEVGWVLFVPMYKNGIPPTPAPSPFPIKKN
ncbi:hypothetical protein L2E82_42080 [Cichorium intybus]|uniref:Uncharacterized protein n=1 Tax=Cichorium intybus TaxID=13427 RepID=A0ACB8ZML7_CICIN|nr:hypothetical protein L2E82_42080 [Cichorium intybus]